MAKEIEKETKKPKKRTTAKKQIEKKAEIKKEEVKIVEEKEKVKVKEKTMKMSYSYKDTIIVMILSIIIGLLFGSVVTHYMDDVKHPDELDDFNEVYKDIRENYYKKTNKNNLTISSLQGLINGLNDRYSYIDDRKTAVVEYEESVEGSFIGIGITVNINENGRIHVVSVFEDSPASKAGINPDDVILTMDGVEYDSSNEIDFSYNVKTSKVGKKIELGILRDEVVITKEVELDEVQEESVSYYEREENGRHIGVFTINNFADNAYDQFYKYYEKDKDVLDSIILDVRCNNEGRMENAVKIASLFLDKDSILYYTHKNNKYEVVKTTENKEINIPVVVVINGGTRSSGEMLASALNTDIGAPIVGGKSFGKGYLQKMVQLNNGKALYYTVSEWVTAKKETVEEVGINPTYEVISEEGSLEDKAINKAIEVLLNK